MDGVESTPFQELSPPIVLEDEELRLAPASGGFDQTLAAVGAGKTLFPIVSTDIIVDIHRFHRSRAHAHESSPAEMARHQGITLARSAGALLGLHASEEGDCKRFARAGEALSQAGGVFPPRPVRAVVTFRRERPLRVHVRGHRFAVGEGVRRAPQVRCVGGDLTAPRGRQQARGPGRDFRVDGGSEWTSADFRHFCDDNNIVIEFPPPANPQYNTVVVESAIWRIQKAAKGCSP